MTKASGVYAIKTKKMALCTPCATRRKARRVADCDENVCCEECDDTLHCPECGSTEVDVVLYVAPTLHFSAERDPVVDDFMLTSGSDECICTDCGHEWIE